MRTGMGPLGQMVVGFGNLLFGHMMLVMICSRRTPNDNMMLYRLRVMSVGVVMFMMLMITVHCVLMDVSKVAVATVGMVKRLCLDFFVGSKPQNGNDSFENEIDEPERSDPVN